MDQGFLFQMAFGALVGLGVLTMVLKPHFKKTPAEKPARSTRPETALPRASEAAAPSGAKTPGSASSRVTQAQQPGVLRLLQLFGGSEIVQRVQDTLAESARLQRMADEDIIAIARDGRKIDAIRVWRLKHGCGLKEAKEAIESQL
ncbi:MAG: hypothetical protein IGS03_13635 [Candidatus Sericytochromatia bacterium]|nr:hypothetical protein [Candidatus Sericytochromatia bacterium]